MGSFKGFINWLERKEAKKMKKEEIKKELEKYCDYIPYTQESDTIIFDCRGADINNPLYNGDIFNHRPTALLLLNDIKIVVEVGTTPTYRTKHKTTKRPLIHQVEKRDNNGLYIGFSVEDVKTFEKSSFYGYHFVNNSFHTNDILLKNDLDEKASYHTKKILLRFINSELKTHFTKAVFINRGNDCLMTVSEALNDPYIRDFDKQPMTPAEEVQLITKAKDRFEMLQFCGIIPKDKNFMQEYCWITSSSLQGVYFPNLNSNIRCFAFGVYGGVVVCLNDEE